MKKRQGNLGYLAIIATVSFAPQVANAAAININDTAANNTITVSACDFEGGFAVNGSSMGSCGVGSGGSITLAETGSPITFSGSWIDLGGASGTYNVAFVEAADPTIVSDVLNVSYGTNGNSGTVTGSFLSALNDNLGLITDPSYKGYSVVVENYAEGQNGFDFSTAYLSANATSAVPEPATLALMGVGLVGLGATRRRKAI